VVRAFLAAAILALVPRAALATCPAGMVPEAMEARLSEEALQLLKGPLAQMVPESFDLPVMSKTLVEGGMGFDPTTVTLLNGVAHVDVKAFSIDLDNGGIILDITADITGDADVDLVLTGLPDAVCTATVAASAAQVHARVAPTATSCELDFPFTALDTTVNPEAVQLQIGGCELYGEAATLIYDYLRQVIVDYVLEQIRAFVEETVPGWLTSFSSELLTDGVVLARMRWQISPTAVVVKPAAIELTFSGGVTSELGPADCLPRGAQMPSLPAAEPGKPSLASSALMSIAASRPFVSRATQAAWLAGWLCFDSRDYDLDMSAATAEFLPGVTLDFDIVAETPPSVAFDGAYGVVDIIVNALNAELFAGGDTSIATTTFGTMLEAKVDVDPETQAVMLAPTGVHTTNVILDFEGDTNILLTQERLTGFFDNFALPLFASAIGAIPVTSGMFVGGPAAIALEDLRITETHLIADLDLWPVNLDDVARPVTVIDEWPRLASPNDVRLVMGSIDDLTPARFLRHVLVIDGAAEEAPYVGTTIEVSGLEDGTHLISLAALDLTDNRDATPVVIELVVDDHQPVVEIITDPMGVSESGEVTVEVSASDDRTASRDLALRYVASLVSRTDEPDQPLEAGRITPGKALALTNLPDGSLVRIVVFAKDEAGNESSAESAVAVLLTPTFGCTALPGLAPLATLVALGLLVRRRRA
jgi:hypothetical protein